MIIYRFYIERYSWSVTAYYAADFHDRNEIMSELVEIGIDDEKGEEAFNNLSSWNINKGLTYAKNGKAVVVIGKANSAEQYENSIAHEFHHLSVFISIAEGIPLNSEEICYLHGLIAQKTHKVNIIFTSE